MARNVHVIEVPPARVYAVLADGWSYSNWVVGTSHMRAVDPRWPAVGARLFHASGAWPFAVRDHSIVEDMQTDRRLVLVAHGRWLGAARIELDLQPQGQHCRVTMRELPVSGPGSRLHSRLSDLALHRRNTEALARLAAIAERRTLPPQ